VQVDVTPTYSDTELEAMMADMKSELVERKGSLRTAPDGKDGPIERIRLRQIAYNAVMHRTYEATHAPVRVSWFDDRVEIVSPGGPYGAVTADNFGQRWIADYRNPSLADAMRVLGIVQRFGMGITVARSSLRRNNQPEPSFEVQSNWVHWTIGARP